MSNLKVKARVTNYKEADEFLGRYVKRKIAYRTYLERITDVTITLRYYGHRIITYTLIRERNECYTVLNSRGYRTLTTKNRLNIFTPESVYIYQRNYTWYIQFSQVTTVFYDGASFISP